MTTQVLRCFSFAAFLILAFLFSGVFLYASTEDELRVEGIALDPVNSKESIAVINGTFLKEGDQFPV